MSWIDRAAGAITTHSKAAIVLMLVLTLVIGTGAGMVEQSSSLGQFQSDSEASRALEYINEHFAGSDENETTVQIILKGENVLDKQSLLTTLHVERAIRTNATIAKTLVENQSTLAIANLVAKAGIKAEKARELRITAAKFARLKRTLQQKRSALAARRSTLNETARTLKAALQFLEAHESASVRTQFEQVQAKTPVQLNATDFALFNRSATTLRTTEDPSRTARAYRIGTRGILADEYAQLTRQAQQIKQLASQLRSLGQQLEQLRTALGHPISPTLREQIDQLESMNASEIDRALQRILTANTTGQRSALVLMPTTYDPGSTTANATMLVVTQRTSGGGNSFGAVTDDIVDAQLAMQDIVASTLDESDMEGFVFGAGIISAEFSSSMIDSLLIVSPLAVVFILVVLSIAYRDLIDILLGLFGLGVVLLWTFGFMGWADIAFNQIFVAVPVLLIGLSIDYAIHTLLRHREERQKLGNGVRGPMKVALSGVGAALVWVTATTVFGFLSNITSPIPPIRDFGIVCAVGITAALFSFGVLIPALKVEIDSFLESRGWNRKKQAFGTGGGRFSEVLSVGSTAARKAPLAIIALALLVSAAGAYGAVHVDTSFDRKAFIADDPPEWMDSLPEPFDPGEYTAKQHLTYINQHFLRQDSQASILVRGEIATPDALAAVARAVDRARSSPVTTELANGDAHILSPLSVMTRVAARNQSFAATLAAADVDGDGVPDTKIENVYDTLYAVAPQRASSVIYRTETGDYRALRLVISTSGTATGREITDEMRAVADVIDDHSGLEAIATGRPILSTIVQNQLLQTVIQSLLITFVAVFAFLMVAYRITDGSATLGAVTLLPVLLSVSWILGTMYLLGIPFNVLTGMITSLTVGMGVAYSIHVSERYNLELERTGSVWEAMDKTVVGTGGALVGSAATTVGGFGVLVFAIIPPLQQFGFISAMTIIYAFLASVLVLPSLLVVWTKYLGPGIEDNSSNGREPVEDVVGE